MNKNILLLLALIVFVPSAQALKWPSFLRFSTVKDIVSLIIKNDTPPVKRVTAALFVASALYYGAKKIRKQYVTKKLRSTETAVGIFTADLLDQKSVFTWNWKKPELTHTSQNILEQYGLHPKITY